MDLKHTESFDLAYRFVTETNLNIFLTGKAGTGKTTFLKYLRQTSFKKMVVTAPTGVAAINAGGVTLHSLFQLPFAPYVPSKDENSEGINSHSLLSQIRYNKEKRNLFRNLELLVIDEVSMVASHTVDAIDTILKSVRRRHLQPFGGTQVLFIGDLYQLPPVVKKQEWEFLKNYYPSIFFFDSKAMQENIPVMMELKEIFRQQDNTFIEVLNEIRNDNLTVENFNLLNSRLKQNFSSLENEEYITLTTHNFQSDEINKRKLKKLPTSSQIYCATIQGNFSENQYPAELELELKEGAQVMFLKNDVEGKKYFNGKIGIVTALDKERIKVKCAGEQQEIEVKKYEWKNMNYSLNADTREIIEEELGSFTQYPLRLAWAITIHKSQGLTFNKLIIDAENAFANGQVYVALSRCTSLDGLVLTSPINQKFLGATQNLREWQEKNNDEKNLQQKFNESRQNYIQQELQNVFTWKNWFYELQELKNIFNEEKENLPSECLLWVVELITQQQTLEEITLKFKDRIIELCNQNSAVEENQLLQKRIKDAANYFSIEIKKWKEKFLNHPLTTDTKKIARQIDASLNEINFIVNEILHKINFCKNGFLLNEYLRNGKKFNGVLDKIQSSYAQHQIKNLSSKELEHPELYERIAEMRTQIADEMNLPLYLIFSNQAIKNVCINLPADKNSLMKVKGFGKAKVGKYGDEVINFVREYCRERNIEPQQIFKKDSRRENGNPKSNTVEETLNQFRQGKKIQDIARDRNLVTETIEGHLAQAIKQGDVNIEELMSMEEVREIAEHIPTGLDYVPLGSVKEKLGDVSYGKLKMVLAWMQKEK